MTVDLENGHAEIPEALDKSSLQKQFSQKFEKLCEDTGCTTRQMAEILKMPHVTFWEYYKGNRMPSVLCLVQLKVAFNYIDLNEFMMPETL